MQNYFLIGILLHTHIAYNANGQNEYFWPPDWWGLTPPVFRPRAIVTPVLSSWFTFQFCPALDCCISLSKTWSGMTSAVSHRSTSSWNACTRLLWFWLEQWCLQLSLLWGSGGEVDFTATLSIRFRGCEINGMGILLLVRAFGSAEVFGTNTWPGFCCWCFCAAFTC